MSDLFKQLSVISEEVASCTKCDLHKGRTNSVFERGNPNAKLMLLGEAGGKDEDEQGLVFVGKSGRLLDSIMEELGLDSNKDAYLCNVVKCRPPNNRPPEEKELQECRHFLDKQIDLIRPTVIVSLGKTAGSALLGREISITKERGQKFRYRGATVIPTYHPSYVLRGAPGAKEKMKEDILAGFLALINLGEEG